MRALPLLAAAPALGLGILVGRYLPAGGPDEVRGADGAAAPRARAATPGDGASDGPAPVAAPTGGGWSTAEVAAGRDEVRTDAEVAAEAELLAATPHPEALQRALEEYLASGLLEDQYADNPQGLAYWLAYQYIHAGEPYEAWKIHRIWPDLGSQVLGDIGQLLKQQGQVASATEALLEAARQDPWDWEWTQELTELDPAGALAALRKGMADNEDLRENGGTYREIQLLLAMDDTEGALARIDELLAGPHVDSSVYDLLSQFPPEVAEERLRARAEDDAFGDARYRLAQLLRDQGDTEGAVDLLAQLLEEMPGNSEALWMLGELDRGEAIAALQNRISSGLPDAETWGALGDQLLAAGRIDEAVDAWLAAFETYPSSDSWSYKLLEHAPERFWPMFEDQTRRSGDDEMWGDLADAYWRNGRHTEAREAWERARQLDPDDGEWTGKLSKVAAGTDPFGGGDSSYDFGFSGSHWGSLPSNIDSSSELHLLNDLGYLIEDHVELSSPVAPPLGLGY